MKVKNDCYYRSKFRIGKLINFKVFWCFDFLWIKSLKKKKNHFTFQQMCLKSPLFIRNIHAACETMNILRWKKYSPIFEQYLNKCSEVCHNKIGTVSLTLYALAWRIRHVLTQFRFENKKGSSKKISMSFATMSR